MAKERPKTKNKCKTKPTSKKKGKLRVKEADRIKHEASLVKEKIDLEIKMAKLAKSKSVVEKLDQVGSARGIESMFRSSYRTQLDMIALAATKANIMISLNGLLVSMLLLSGAYFLTANHLILIPVSILILTCTFAIIFAVLAARPDVDNRKQGLADFMSDDADILIFEQFSKLSSQEFNDAMWDLLNDQERIYKNMISHLYDLGCIADKKFARLYTSYNGFIIGLVMSVLSLLGIVGYQVFPGLNIG